MFCKHCGKEIDENSEFCKHCGGKQNEDTAKYEEYMKNNYSQQNVNYVYIKQPKSQFLAVVFCLFLGLIGIHDFYLDNYNRGFIKILILILLGWCGVGLVINLLWCLVDLINIATKAEKVFYTLADLNKIIDNPQNYSPMLLEYAKEWKKEYEKEV